LYSVGVSLYYLLTGHYPYGEIEAFQRPRFNTPVSASRYRPDLPDWLQQSLERSVAAQAAQRYETAEEWLLVLEQADRRELSLRPRPLLEREPLKVWQTLALVSLLINLLLLYLLSL
jgi:serine/threonine protein kinase